MIPNPNIFSSNPEIRKQTRKDDLFTMNFILIALIVGFVLAFGILFI